MADHKSPGAGAAVVDQAAPQALTKASEAKTPEIITRPDEYTTALKGWGDKFNVLTPFTSVSGIAPQHGLVASQVRINTDAAYGSEKIAGGGETYGGLPFLNGSRGQQTEELAIAKNGLRKLAECAGISYRTERTDPRTIPHYWEFKAIASYRGIDGSVVTREATMEWDLRDGSERMKGWKPNQITEGRKNGLRNCEARVINAVIRECGCGIKQKYTRAELSKPFLVLRVAFQPDMTDPEQRRMVAEAGLRSTSTLYGPPVRSLGAGSLHDDTVDDDVVDEPRRVGQGTAAAEATAAAKSEPDPDAPPSADAVRVVKVDSRNGETKGRAWTRYTVMDSTGAECSTLDKTVAEEADKARQSKAWVELVCETNGNYRNLIEIIPAGSEPKLPDMENT